MAKNKTTLDPLPKEFKTPEEFTQFWDTHDTEDYPDAWREVNFRMRMSERKYPSIVLEPQLAHKLNRHAQNLGVSLNELVNQLLNESLRHITR